MAGRADWLEAGRSGNGVDVILCRSLCASLGRPRAEGMAANQACAYRLPGVLERPLDGASIETRWVVRSQKELFCTSAPDCHRVLGPGRLGDRGCREMGALAIVNATP